MLKRNKKLIIRLPLYIVAIELVILIINDELYSSKIIAYFDKLKEYSLAQRYTNILLIILLIVSIIIAAILINKISGKFDNSNSLYDNLNSSEDDKS